MRGSEKPNAADSVEAVATDLEDIRWWTLPETAEQLGVEVSEVRRMVRDREVVAVRRGERDVLKVPAAMFDHEGPVKALPGTVVVLMDGRMGPEEIVKWLFEPDDTLREGSALADLRAGHKTEIRRRAAESAW